MNKKNNYSGPSSLMALQPVDNAPFKEASPTWLVWLSIALVALASLLPWRQWQPVPDVLLLLLMFWAFHEPTKVGLLAAFVFGVLIDVHDTNLLGQSTLYYLLSVYGVMFLHRRLQHFNSIVQMLHIAPIVLFAAMISNILSAWLNGSWVGWNWLWSALITVVLWPLVDVLMFLHQRRSAADDVSSV